MASQVPLHLMNPLTACRGGRPTLGRQPIRLKTVDHLQGTFINTTVDGFADDSVQRASVNRCVARLVPVRPRNMILLMPVVMESNFD